MMILVTGATGTVGRKQGMPPERADAVLAARRSGASQRGMPVVPTVERITGRPPSSYAEWVDAHLDAFR